MSENVLDLGKYFPFMLRGNAFPVSVNVRRMDYTQVAVFPRPNNSITEGVCLLNTKNAIAHANIAIVPVQLTTIGISEKEDANAKLIAEFNERAERWQNETAIHSAPGAKFLHKDYIAIMAIGMGNQKAIVPLILERIEEYGVDWFFALENIAGENPAKGLETFDEALNAWREWAKSKSLVK